MRLSALKILNHSRVADLDVEVRDHLVLVGTNESGKSSILRCLDLLLGAPRARLYATLGAADVRDPAHPFVVEASLTGADRALFAAADAPGAVRLRLDVHVADDGETVDINRRVVTGDGGAELTAAQLAAISWTMLPDDADAHIGDTPMLRRLFATLALDDERRALVRAEHQADGALRRSPALRALRERIAGQLTAALPGRYRGDDLVFVADARGDDPFDRVRLRLRGPHGQRDLGAQSGGMRAVFVVALFDLLDSGGGIIAFDEPETHLHPTSQRNLARLLARGPSQKIIATHAPDVIGEFEPDEIVVVRAGDVVQPRRDFLDDDDKLLLHMWVRDRLEPLTAEHVVVVEGITDRVLLERCADVTGRNLDTYGVVVLEAGGCREMPAWRRVFASTGSRCRSRSSSTPTRPPRSRVNTACASPTCRCGTSGCPIPTSKASTCARSAWTPPSTRSRREDSAAASLSRCVASASTVRSTRTRWRDSAGSGRTRRAPCSPSCP
ncbi:ATP-dependent endonuclease, OLD family protein [Bifidobacterium castoris]|uniref:ATP-dependent endonuclease, OLD family protein n=2 Tax=Bifidobacterium castoris TaxID=2306972 RepID=A0A430F5K9_9BIFI|nr:ATP-dependent endonuclease, OLD family protein [Bifidobacterium castoris]